MIILYLVRHGKADATPDDFYRRLTSRGREESKDIARLLKREDLEGAVIQHSPLSRAVETAEIIAKATALPSIEVNDLTPGADPESLRERLVDAQTVILVGHNPFMESLAALLLTQDVDAPVLAFRTAGAAKLVSVPSGGGRRFTCEWLVHPRILQD